ncbi:MAG TPA: HigA family addiction module antitoxin [Acidobacteriaceae bacterium]|nr:HigA family addiction module antitoxin [Acidobacteriaceae bacterium]
MEMYNPPHPGLLIEDILENGELKIGNSVTALAKHLGVTRAALSRVIHGRAAVSAEMALKPEAALGVSADMWLKLQNKRDLWVASRKRRKKIKRLVPVEQKRAA